ncbi:PPE family protein [Mycolicibacterium neoaurum]|uniref:PPE family protein n=1 Tax=Mycolicibacterium neoaurum TaxID=1795 RepID=UPI0027E1DF60|nr:PPE domain-containing protein [Mycolicibacterium neoaurum]
MGAVVAVTPPAPPIWHAAPPEVHSTLLNTGMTAAPIAAAGAVWTQTAAQYAAAIAELEGILMQVQANYRGPSAEKFIAAHQPMLLWLADVMAKATLTAGAHGEIAAAYTSAVAAMPTMAELINNHVVHGVLVGTNFFGVNTIPIGMNEADYIRMWNQAADVQGAYDVATALGVDQIPDTTPSPMPMIPGVGESGSIAATAASFLTQGVANAGGMSLTGASMMGDKLMAGKIATSPASLDKFPGTQPGNTGKAADQNQDLAQQAQNTGGNMMQQVMSMASSAPQAAASAIQQPANMLMQAPQQLAQAPQQLASMLSQFAGSFGGDAAQVGSSGMPVGFPGTGAISGFNPAGMTSLAGGALGTGPARPLMPSTWGASPTSATDPVNNAARSMSPMGAGLPGAGASGGGAGGSGMMGSGAQRRRGQGAQAVNTYSDEAVDEDYADADGDGGTFAMTR